MQVTVADFGYPVFGPFDNVLPKTVKLFGFPFFVPDDGYSRNAWYTLN